MMSSTASTLRDPRACWMAVCRVFVCLGLGLALGACSGVTAPMRGEQLESTDARFDVRGYATEPARTYVAEYLRWSDSTWYPLGSTKPITTFAGNRAEYLDTTFYLFRIGNLRVPNNGWTPAGARQRARLRVRFYLEGSNRPSNFASAATMQEVMTCIIPKLGVATNLSEAALVTYCNEEIEFDIFAP